MGPAGYKIAVFVAVMAFAVTVRSQEITSIGWTGAFLNHRDCLAGGLAMTIQKNLWRGENSSISLGTTIKVGIEDKVGSGWIVPAVVLLSKERANRFPDKDSSGGRVNLFLDVPLLVHYNVGPGAVPDAIQRIGFYFGGGVTYTFTGYTDEARYSRPTRFVGLVADGGIRLMKWLDINYAAVFPLKRTIGPINHPFFSEISFAIFF